MALLCKSDSIAFSAGFCERAALTAIEAPTILALRRDPRLLKTPPYLSAVCVVIGIVWLLLLPLNEYSRHTYISENALLPGQVHTYFSGSEQNVFNAYKHEVQALTGKDHGEYAFLGASQPGKIWLMIW